MSTKNTLLIGLLGVGLLLAPECNAGPQQNSSSASSQQQIPTQPTQQSQPQDPDSQIADGHGHGHGDKGNWHGDHDNHWHGNRDHDNWRGNYWGGGYWGNGGIYYETPVNYDDNSNYVYPQDYPIDSNIYYLPQYQ